MKIACTKRIFCICMVVLIGMFCSSIAWADFYVIASGKRAKKTILVSPKSTETASGTALLNAMAGITDAGETNPYLIIIEPGVYNIGTSSLQMKSYVDIQGSGENVTKITGTINNQFSGVLVGANNAEVRFVTIENTSGGAYTIAIFNTSVSPTITNVTAVATGGTNSAGVSNREASSPIMTNVTATTSGATGDTAGISNRESSSPTMTNVSATASGGTDSAGVYNNASSPTMTDVIATASGGTTNSVGVSNEVSSSPTMTDIKATASGGGTSSIGVHNNASSPTMQDITATASGGGTSSIGVYNNASSPTMRDITATASSGGTNSIGVHNEVSSSPEMTNVTATATTGGENSLGVYNNASSPTMTNVVATASGGTGSVGVSNDASSPVMTNVTATASGGGTSNVGVSFLTSGSPTMNNVTVTASGGISYGVYNSASTNCMINNSVISGGFDAISTSSGATTYVGSTQLDGGVSGSGTHKCVNAYNENFTSKDTDCTDM